MKKLIPYLIISGQCEQALRFYQDCFGGDIVFLQKYAQTNYSVSADFKDKVAHAEFKSDQINFYASDGFEDQQVKVGDNVAFSINFSDGAEQKSIFDRLKVGGRVTMDFSETSANSMLATLIDQYGIHWYLNSETHK